jgi:hypothetical protein
MLQGLGAVGGLLRGVSSLVREAKRPTIDNKDFAALLREQMHMKAIAKPGKDPAAETARIEKATAEFVTSRDSDGDGLLSIEETGFDKETFKRLDADGDGRLTAAELAKPHLEAMKRYGHASNSNA